MGREDLAREALTRKSGADRADHRPQGAAGASSRARRRSSPSPSSGCRPRSRPSAPEGDDQGDLHRRRGADPDQRGVLRHLARRWATSGMAIQRAEDKTAQMQARGRRHRRADRLRRARRRHRDQRAATTSPASSTRCQLAVRRRGRAGPRSRPAAPPQAIEAPAATGAGRRRRASRRSRRRGAPRRTARHDRPDPRRGAVRRRRRRARPRSTSSTPRSRRPWRPATRRRSPPALAALLDGVRAAGTPAARRRAGRVRPDPAAVRRDASTRSASCSADEGLIPG